MNIIGKLILKLSTICLSIIVLFSCSSQKDTAANRGLQNLSARYNYIYNANIILNNYQNELTEAHKDNYDNFLKIYIAPVAIDYITTSANAKELDDITVKAQAIIAEKNLSNYTDEAYMLLGKSNFYKGDYFNATAYFDYSSKAYKKDKNIYLSALNWKARSLMQLNDFAAANKILDTVKTYLDSVKRNRAEPLATLAQMSIYKYDYKEAIVYLEKGIKETSHMQARTRWPFILAQLYEHEKEYNLSLRNYTKVENSNAPFVLYFNAKLSKIRINDALNDVTTNRKKQLLKLLKDDKNLDFTDQIYYEVAEDYYADNDYEKAIAFYQLSTQKTTINQYQKGISYLKIAEINFKELKDYVNSKLYYDSAITTLPKNYPNYESIVTKGQNLEYLTERFQLIAYQDTLQLIANLNEQDRAKKLDAMFEAKKEVVVLNIGENNKIKTNNINNKAAKSDGTFYFSNQTAISKGFSDFKKKWGNRVLEDNWRQSGKSSRQITQQNQIAALDNRKDTLDSVKITGEDNKTIEINKYIALLPNTPELLNQSNQKIIDSYFEIGAFYQQVLNDPEEAIKTYELLLQRFPENKHLETVYYSLYLGYKDIDETKATIYKNNVLNKYPNSIFAKTILDPNFTLKQNALELEINNAYNQIFATYQEKDFPKVISSVDEINQRFPNNDLKVQYDYLKAIAIGRTQDVNQLLAAFDKIKIEFSEDQLITPLVKNHLNYINANLNSFKSRKIALIDFDPLEPPFIGKQEANPIVKQPVKTNNLLDKKTAETTAKMPTTPAVINPILNTIETTTENKNVKNKAVVDNFFSIAESKTYYYVIAVADVSVSLSSSRFGIGQFNRGNYSGENLKHQLTELDEDQLIFVGDFDDLDKVKAYDEVFAPQLSKIMKVPATSYKGFYISKENFVKLKNKETINRYLEFFKNNF